MAELATKRLRLRQWRPADRAPFAALNADPEVMRHFPAPLSREQSGALADRVEAVIAAQGWGLWAVEVPGVAAFAGFIGLAVPQFEAHFTPAIEVGWRLDRAFWGRGYATEGARAALGFAFDELGLIEVVSFTTVANDRSRRVMERLSMTHDPADDFDHPRLAGSPIQRHVLYRLRADQLAADRGCRVRRADAGRGIAGRADTRRGIAGRADTGRGSSAGQTPDADRLPGAPATNSDEALDLQPARAARRLELDRFADGMAEQRLGHG